MSSAANPVRRAAFETVRRTFEHDAWTDRAFPAAARRHGLEGRDRARAQRLAYGAVQRRGTSDDLVTRLGRRPLEDLDAPVIAALRLGLYELLFIGTDDGADDHAVVDGWVELAKLGIARERRDGRRARAAAGFANAVLRRAAAERHSLLRGLDDATPAGAAIAHSVPEWLAEMWWDELGPESARSLMAAINEPLPTALRISDPGDDPADLAGRIGDGARPGSGDGLLEPPGAVIVDGPLGDQAVAMLEGGRLVAQSLAAQAVVALVGARPGERVLDLCAGPGVKATALAARLGREGNLTAVEIDAGRARQIAELAERVEAGPIEVIVGDGAEADLGDGYDRVLVDPPCSDLGTLASRPDARWRKSRGAIDELAGLQKRLLERGIEAARPGGTVVYSTCTISRAEGEEVVAAATLDAPAEIEDLGALEPGLAHDADSRFLQTRPDRDRTDGFFIARIARTR